MILASKQDISMWTDMIFEQELMKNLKFLGGITRDRGASDTIVSGWRLGMKICNAGEVFCEVDFMSSKQHMDSYES